MLSLAEGAQNADQFKLQGTVTQSAAYIYGSDMWKKVTMRLGTDITRYLLESCSVFVAAPPSCVVQVCGVPVYDRVSMTTSSARFCLQPPLRMRKVALFGRGRGAGTGYQRRGDKNPAIRKTKNAMDVKVKGGKRKREPDSNEEEIITCSKRRRAREQEVAQETQQVSSDTVEGRQPVEPTLSIKTLGKDVPASKQHARMQKNIIPMEGGPSWRSGTFPPLPPSQSFIRTLGLLYGGKGIRGFLLNRKKKTADGCRRLKGHDLLRIVFFEGLSYLNGFERKPKKLPRRFFNMLPLFSQLLRKHRSCPYNRILQRMCPLVGSKDAEQEEISSLLPQHCRPHRVYLFIRDCLSAVIPQELWGSDHNRSLFFTRVRGFLRSGRSEKLSVAELMWKMKVNDCDWLKISKTGISRTVRKLFLLATCMLTELCTLLSSGRFPPSELSYRTQILGQFLGWLLDGYVVGLVRSCFYVTESLGQKNAVRFYRQEVWAKMQDLAFRYT